MSFLTLARKHSLDHFGCPLFYADIGVISGYLGIMENKMETAI